MPKPELISVHALQQMIRQPHYVVYHTEALDREKYGSVTKVSVADVLPGGAELSKGSYLSVSLEEENSRTQRLVYLPYSSQLAEELMITSDLKDAVWPYIKQIEGPVIISEWLTRDEDEPPVTYSLPSLDLLRAYGVD